MKVQKKSHVTHYLGDLKVCSNLHVNTQILCARRTLLVFHAGATKFIHKLDERYKKDCAKRGNSNMQGKHRVQGNLSALPRLSGPEWALKAAPPTPESASLNHQPVPVSHQPVPVNHQPAPLTSGDSDSDSDSDSDLADLFQKGN